MFETIISSSVLIIVLILLRYLFKGKMNLQLQYALWLLVAIRLLIPFPLFNSSLSVLNIVDMERQEKQVERSSILPLPQTAPTAETTANEWVTGGTKAPETSHEPKKGVQTDFEIKQNGKLLSKDILRSVWLLGIAVTGLWLVVQNIWFYIKLRKTRKTLDIKNSRLPVYLTSCVKSPCLFGLFHPAIYMHPDRVPDGQTMTYILAHEETHYRHWDHLWSYLRCVCLTIHWFNPLVWWAAVLSRRDCEIACDESTLNRMGDEHRKAYGKTLINMIAFRSKPSDLLCSATTMTSGKSGIKERITMIAKKPKMLLRTVIVVILIMAAIVGCTFTGANKMEIESLTDEELSYFNGDEFFNGEYSICNQFLSSIYESPEKVDLYQLFYNGMGEIVTEAERAAVVTYNGWDTEPDTTCQKISRSKIDAVLTEYMGLTLQDTKKIGLENFTYLKEYDAYYNYHGDTNYRLKIFFSGGQRDGDIIRLFYDDVFFADGEKILTLLEKNGSYFFVSNVYAETPNGDKTEVHVTLYERSGVIIAIPNEYTDQLLIDPVEHEDDTTLISVYQKSTYEKYDRAGFLFSIARYTEAQYEQFLTGDGSGQSFFAKDGKYYYGFFYATDVQSPEDYKAFSVLFSAVGDFVKSDMISRNGLTPYNDNEFFNRTNTYDSEHIFFNYYPYYAHNGSKEEVWTLILSQPARKGDTGIWCVERWKDHQGNIYPYFPDENGMSSVEYYTALQAECDAGKNMAWLEPEQVALAFVKKVFQHDSATTESLVLSDNLADSVGYDENIFGLYIPESECSIYLDAYPVDFPFGCDLQEISRRNYRVESFGQVYEIESDGLQVKYLNNTKDVYFVFSIRTVKKGYSVAGIAVGDTEEFLLGRQGDKPFKKMDGINDELWFGKYDLAYVYTSDEGTKSIVYLIKDGLVFGIEIINGLDGPMY